jgi:hypothetical protein
MSKRVHARLSQRLRGLFEKLERTFLSLPPRGRVAASDSEQSGGVVHAAHSTPPGSLALATLPEDGEG